MWLSRLSVQGLRNLSSLKLAFSPRMNVIAGANASGKTSLLEAIYLLSTARSFRSANTRSLIQQGQTGLVVQGDLQLEGRQRRMGIQRDQQGSQLRLDGQKISSMAELARNFPVQVIHPGGIQLLEQGPKLRRQFLDWGVFHVEPAFLEGWRRYVRCLKQRNAALRAKDRADARAFDPEFINTARGIHDMRLNYIEQLQPVWQHYSQVLIGDNALEIRYQRGWDRKSGLQQQLEERLARDSQRGFTSVGPHRADIVLLSQGNPVQSFYSRGQQKLLVCALRLAQADILQKRLQRNCVFLVDDLPAELDSVHRGVFMQALADLHSQVFVTTTEADLVPLEAWPEYSMFHVEHGNVQKVV
jgi:DNA replication and repair protein RecF